MRFVPLSSPPVIDLDRWFDGTERQRSKLSREVDVHLQAGGIVLVTNHGIDREVFAGLRESGERFFGLDTTEKARAAYGDGWGWEKSRGERFVFGPVDTRDPTVRTAYPDAYRTNEWPTDPDDFQAASELFWRETRRLADQLLQLCALAIDLPQSAIADQCRDSTAVGALHCINEETSDDPAFGVISNVGTLSIAQAPPGDTRIQSMRSDGWTDIPVDDGSLVVAVGSMLQRWTNDRWVSPRQRLAREPIPQGTSGGTVALMLFDQPDADAVIAPFSTCVSIDEPSGYEPILAMDYAAERAAASGAG